jgi:hypothetical protein
MRTHDDEVYLTTQEANKKYGFGVGTLFYFRDKMTMLESYKFFGDKKLYWKETDLAGIKNRPPEVTQRGKGKEVKPNE